MEINISVLETCELKIASSHSLSGDYPTSQLQRGLILYKDGLDLGEEGVGFGVPVVKIGHHAIFPGRAVMKNWLQGNLHVVEVSYRLYLEERLAYSESGNVDFAGLYTLKDWLALVIRKSPLLRTPLTVFSTWLRKVTGWRTAYDESKFSITIPITYTIDSQAGSILVEVSPFEPEGTGVTEINLMNEQGANTFDHYQDSSVGDLKGEQIGCWDLVTAHQASFTSQARRVSFTLNQVQGAKLIRGRELVGNRLAWAGFGYCFSPTVDKFSYQVQITNIP